MKKQVRREMERFWRLSDEQLMREIEGFNHLGYSDLFDKEIHAELIKEQEFRKSLQQ
jgi:hypothetical protein